ncbi:MAG: DNA polymerase III subunit beta [Rhodospirillaceae bacterium]|jgi:DNA polymerase-3 subunit beta|nr:DNA polymerase III subunit beta [Rhodospirillaceae bacterium]
MKLIIERTALFNSLSRVQSVIERRNTVPILSNIKIESHEEGWIDLSATDMVIDIIERASADVEQSGSTTVPVHILYDIIRKLPNGSQIEIEQSNDSDKFVLRSGDYCFTLSSLPSSDYPTISSDSLSYSFVLNQKNLKWLIDKTRIAILNEETRYYLNGIYLHVKSGDDGSVLCAVATDGHRLAFAKLPSYNLTFLESEGSLSNFPGVIIPRKTVIELKKIIDIESNEPQNVTISLSEKIIRFAFNDVLMTSKLIDGTFPDYERVIPKNNSRVLNINRKDLLKKIDMLSSVSNDRSCQIELTISNDKCDLLMRDLVANHEGSGYLKSSYKDNPMKIGFNSRYLIEILEQIDGDNAQLILANETNQVLIKGDKEVNYSYVLMPTTLRSER